MSTAEVKSRIWQYLKHYSYGCFAYGFNSSTKAVDAFIGIAVGASINPEDVQAPNWQMALFVFGTVWARKTFEFLALNPIPSSLTTHPFTIHENKTL